jgi:hypothetical protein
MKEYIEAELDDCNSKIINTRDLYIDIMLSEGLQA